MHLHGPASSAFAAAAAPPPPSLPHACMRCASRNPRCLCARSIVTSRGLPMPHHVHGAHSEALALRVLVDPCLCMALMMMMTHVHDPCPCMALRSKAICHWADVSVARACAHAHVHGAHAEALAVRMLDWRKVAELGRLPKDWQPDRTLKALQARIMQLEAERARVGRHAHVSRSRTCELGLLAQ